MKYESELEHIEQFSEEEREEIASFYEKMSKASDTPETDAEVMDCGMGHFMVDAEFARRLERERDEAQKQVALLADCVEFIATWGGKKHETECGPINCSGSWCAEQAQTAFLEYTRLKLAQAKERTI